MQLHFHLIRLSMCLALGGCQSIHTTYAPAKPASFVHQVERDPLIIHSDFLLPSEHRLIEELISQRGVLSEKLKLTPTNEPIHVYLFSDDKAYHDYVNQRFPNFANRRAIFVETDISLSVYAHWGDHVAVDLRHEVSHGYLHSAIPNLPFWLDEGLAEYFEVARGQHGVNQPHLDYLAAKADLEGWKPDISRLEQLPAAETMTQEDYAEAWAWVHFLLESGDKAAILTDYLNDLRQGDDAGTLSTRISKRLAVPELALAEHLQSLR
ncbi:MAG: DUF1570 domain-containing protein [Planctomycetes bacterium]|nr:DUF1570 domain-containing protein [Planctomycetota bacterium]